MDQITKFVARPATITVTFTQLERAWLKQCINHQRAALDRSRKAKPLENDLRTLRDQEIALLDELKRKLS